MDREDKFYIPSSIFLERQAFYYDQNRYYLSTDGSFYYDNDSFKRRKCTPEMVQLCQKYIETFEKMD